MAKKVRRARKGGKAKKTSRPKTKKKKAVRKGRAPARRKAARKSKRKAPKKPSKFTPEPGEKLIGVVSHYFPKVQAAAIKLTKDGLAVGETLHIKGHTTNFTETVQSLQVEHEAQEHVKKGTEIGVRVSQRVRVNDAVFKRI